MTHTWELNLYYHQCPACGHIIESRKDFSLILKKYVKELKCPSCNHQFTLEKKTDKRPFGPIFGKPSKPEFDWS
jgi:endogenous inhibitor of DNA gyrase (YacG/DUF329 family)